MPTTETKFCCTECFSEPEIQRFIRDQETLGNCDYCGSEGVYISDVREVGEFILEGVHRYYEDAAQEVGYESAEGGYLLPTLLISQILVDKEEIFGDTLDDPNPLLEDLVSEDGTPYVRRNPYGPPDGDPDEIHYWNQFCDVVKTQKRFTAFLEHGEEETYDHTRPKGFLAHLAEHYLPSLIHILQKGTTIYRARIRDGNKEYRHEDLTSPPPEHSRNSRMSPVGIPFFYGSKDHETCIHEVRPSIAEHVVVAEFEALEDLFVLDLTEEIEPPLSIFHPEYYFSYEQTAKPFLSHFAADISKPIRTTDSDIEYVPTQVFTEFIRSINFRDQFLYYDKDGKETDVFLSGILFRSSIKKQGINVTLFRGPDISTPDTQNHGDAWLLYRGQKTYCIEDIDLKPIQIDT